MNALVYFRQWSAWVCVCAVRRALYTKNKINDITSNEKALLERERIYRNDDVVEFLSSGIYCFIRFVRRKAF